MSKGGRNLSVLQLRYYAQIPQLQAYDRRCSKTLCLIFVFCECIYACSHLEIMGIFQGLDKYTQSITPLCAGIVWTIQREEKKNQP